MRPRLAGGFGPQVLLYFLALGVLAVPASCGIGSLAALFDSWRLGSLPWLFVGDSHLGGLAAVAPWLWVT